MCFRFADDGESEPLIEAPRADVDLEHAQRCRQSPRRRLLDHAPYDRRADAAALDARMDLDGVQVDVLGARLDADGAVVDATDDHDRAWLVAERLFEHLALEGVVPAPDGVHVI